MNSSSKINVGTKSGIGFKKVLSLSLAISLLAIPVVQGGNGYLFKKNAEEEKNSKYRHDEKSYETTEAFARYMNDPYVEQLWHGYQGDVLQTAPDQILEEFFRRHPIFSQMFYLLEKNQGVMLERFLMDQRQSVRLITENSDSESLAVRRLLIEVAKKIGFNQKAIENMTLFMQIGGSANAFTVSGSIDHIIVSINMETIKQMQPAQLAAVIAHELYHIVFRHVIKGSLMDLMFGVMIETLSHDSDQMSLAAFVDVMENSAWLKQVNSTKQKYAASGSLTKARMYHNEVSTGWLKELVPDARRHIYKSIYNTLIELDEKSRKELIVEFIETLKSGLHETGHEVRPEVFDYLNSIEASLKTRSHYTPHVDAEEMAVFLGEISNTFSRWWELSCDMGAASMVHSLEVASAMSLLVLGDESTGPLDRYRSVLNAQEAFKENQKILNKHPHLLADLVSGTDHPEINMRIHMIMETFPAYPLILFANGFTRLMLLEDVLREASVHPYKQWEQYQALRLYEKHRAEQLAAMAQDAGVRKKKTKVAAPKETLPQFEKIEDMMAFYAEKHTQVVAEITHFVMSLENRIMKAGARNVRLDNLFQVVGAHYQELIERYKYWQEQIPVLEKMKGKEAKYALQDVYYQMEAVVEELDAENPLIEAVRQSYLTAAPDSEARALNIQNRLSLFKELESLKPALKVGQFDPVAIAKFQESVTPNAPVEGALDAYGEPIYYRSRIPYPNACRMSLEEKK